MRVSVPRGRRLRRGSSSSNLRFALLAGCSLAACLVPPARAQDAGGEPAETVMVTGSRIARTGMTTPTPVTTVNAEELQTMAPGALIEVFDTLPQFLGNSAPDTTLNFAGSAGASNLNMRGLESKRTLVLINGRRMVSTNRLGTVDINVFPEAALKSVEVVTGGASAAYGTDAVAGVTNFILDTDFEGLAAHAQTGVTQRNDNRNYELSVTGGRDLGDKAHVIGSFEYYGAEEVKSWVGRDWYQGWGVVTNPDWRADGSGTGPQRLTVPNVVSNRSTFGGMFLQPGSALDFMYFQPDGTMAKFQLSDLSAIDPVTGRPYGTFSQSVTNGGSGDDIARDPNRRSGGSITPEVERSSTFLYADYDVTPSLTVYGQGIYGTNRVELNNSVGVMEDTNYLGTIYRENPFLPQAARDIMTAENRDSIQFQRTHSSADLFQGRMQTTNLTLSLTGGFDYDIDTSGFFDGWKVSGYYQRGENNSKIRLHDFVRTDRLFAALDAVVDPATGNIVCNRSLYDAAWSDCVPINLFGAGVASQESIDYVLGRDQPDKVIYADVTQDVAELTASGDVFDGFGAGPVSLALGASYRKDALDQYVGPGDVLTNVMPAANDPSKGIRGIPNGFLSRTTPVQVQQFSSATPIAGSYNVKEFFGETLIPLVADVPFIDRLETNLSARWADYSGSGGIWAWKAGVDWRIYSDLRFRATRSRDVRAANLSERFDRQGQGTSAEDPMFNDERFSFSQTIGGNPNVDPEVADTITAGLVYQPSFFDGFSISADWYDIQLDGAIGQLGTQVIIDDCYAGATDLCQYITRNPDGTLARVDNLFINIAEMRVNGWDFEASYRHDLDLLGGDESVRVRVLASLLTENSITNPGAPKRDSAGSGTLFDTSVTANATYMNGPWSLFVQGQYLGEQTRNILWVEGVDIDWNTIDPVFYTDLGLTYTTDKAGGNWEIFGNVKNVFNVEPPLAPTFTSGFSGSGQTNNSAYDILGRRFTAGVRVRF